MDILFLADWQVFVDVRNTKANGTITHCTEHHVVQSPVIMTILANDLLSSEYRSHYQVLYWSRRAQS